MEAGRGVSAPGVAGVSEVLGIQWGRWAVVRCRRAQVPGCRSWTSFWGRAVTVLLYARHCLRHQTFQLNQL